MITRVKEFQEINGMPLAVNRGKTAQPDKKKSILKKMDYQQHAV